jgi:hypothetical protein
MDFIEQTLLSQKKPFSSYIYPQPLTDLATTNNPSAWQPYSQLNNAIRENEGISSNWGYRTYMTQNANQIRKYNLTEAQQAIGLPIYFKSARIDLSNNTDLKNNYVTQQQKLAKLVSPEL